MTKKLKKYEREKITFLQEGNYSKPQFSPDLPSYHTLNYSFSYTASLPLPSLLIIQKGHFF